MRRSAIGQAASKRHVRELAYAGLIPCASEAAISMQWTSRMRFACTRRGCPEACSQRIAEAPIGVNHGFFPGKVMLLPSPTSAIHDELSLFA